MSYTRLKKSNLGGPMSAKPIGSAADVIAGGTFYPSMFTNILLSVLPSCPFQLFFFAAAILDTLLVDNY